MTDKILSETSLVRYDAMLFAIEQCHKIDEIKELHDKALALELYAKVAMNTDAERKAVEIRIRAERRAGELLKATEKAEPTGGDRGNQHTGGKPASVAALPSPYRAALDSAGINERTGRRWQNLADIPKERFEAHLAADDKPSSRAIIDSVKAKPQMSKEALWLWGRLHDFERLGMIDCDPDTLIDELTESMREDVFRLVPLIVGFLSRCSQKEVA
jgi:hypothetical protein